MVDTELVATVTVELEATDEASVMDEDLVANILVGVLVMVMVNLAMAMVNMVVMENSDMVISVATAVVLDG